MRLYNYWRSSSSWRVRIALAWKGVEHQYVPVNLRRGAQGEPGFTSLNPMAQVPTLVLRDGRSLSQSAAIIEYLEERYPEPPLLPGDLWARARARELTQIVNAGIQPLQNGALTREIAALGGDPGGWSRAHIERGLAALEAEVEEERGPFLVGDAPTIADVFLVPQLYNARRFGCYIEDLPTLLRVERACMALPAFRETRPEAQPDAG